jgi:hypothetical protein
MGKRKRRTSLQGGESKKGLVHGVFLITPNLILFGHEFICPKSHIPPLKCSRFFVGVL